MNDRQDTIVYSTPDEDEARHRLENVRNAGVEAVLDKIITGNPDNGRDEWAIKVLGLAVDVRAKDFWEHVKNVEAYEPL